MTTFAKKVREALQACELPDCPRIMVAVSGGADSVALLRALATIVPNTQLVVAHLNHGIRQQADSDADFVAELCRKLEIEFIGERANIPQQATEFGISLEMAARDARYHFFAKAAAAGRCDAVVTAHTQDDQAETVLLKLIRGAGGAGLDGIEKETRISGLRVIRPMLAISRREVEAFLHSISQNWIEDATNTDTKIPRNLIRHEIIPQLQQLNPQLKKALARTAAIMRDENRLLDDMAKTNLERISSSGVLNVAELMNQAPALQRRILRAWLVSHGLSAAEMRFDTIDRIMRMARNRKGTGAITLSGSLSVSRSYNILTAEKHDSAPSLPLPATVLQVPGTTLIESHNLKITTTLRTGFVHTQPEGIGHLPATAVIQWDNNATELIVRSWLPGDTIQPIGMTGHRKLQDIFTDAKTAKNTRKTVPVFICNDRIAWIPGYRIASARAVANQQQPSLQIRVSRITDGT